MEKVAFIYGETFIYWSSVILTLAVISAVAVFAGLYLWKSKNGMALSLTLPVAMVLSVLLSRWIHWYCLTDSYVSMEAAMTDYTWGGYALMGVFAGCLLTACLMRVTRISTHLPQMLDCMCLAGGVGIAVGRLASMYNASDRGQVVAEEFGMPFAYPVTDAVSGIAENRLATFMLQSVSTAAIVGLIMLYLLICCLLRKKVRDGDTTLLFILLYGVCQIILDSTRYDSLFMRSNGFISIVQILGAVSLVVAIVVFSVRMVKARGFKWFFPLFWVGILGLMGGAGYMEYYVQRHGDQAAFAYRNMGICLAVIVLITLTIRTLAVTAERKQEK
jgi:prolipoprotein diacylglyceryltransferase